MHLNKIPTFRQWLSALLITSLLTGCSVFSTKQQTTAEVYLSPSLQWHIPPLSALPGRFELTQQVNATYNDNTFDLIFQVEKSSGNLAIVAMAPSGLLLLQLNYDGHHVTGSVSPIISKKISLPYLVSDFMLAFGQTAQLQQALLSAGAQLAQTANTRIVTDKSSPLITITYSGSKDNTQWPDTVHYKNSALGYTLAIKTLNHTTL